MIQNKKALDMLWCRQVAKIWNNLLTFIFLLSSQCPETLILLGTGLSHNPILLTCLHFLTLQVKLCLEFII